jgi:N-acetylneuraminate synthase
MDTPCITIGQRRIGRGRPVYVVAEISANHNRSFAEAARIIEAAAEAGADAVKLQTYTPDTMTIRCDRECFRISGGTPWDGKTLYDLYAEAYTPWEWHAELKAIAGRLGMDFFSTAFDSTAVDFLESLGVPVHKIASFENVDLPLIRKMAAAGKPLILSTGMSSLEEIEEAVGAARGAGAREIALLKCTSAYPAPPDEMNLRAIQDLEERFHAPVGLSDHTLGIAVPAAAVALGACIVEKHFTMTRSAGGPDSAFSLEPDEMKEMISAIRTVEQALGAVRYGVNPREAASAAFRRSLFVVQDMDAGDLFTTRNLRSIRPAQGLHPRYLETILGRRAACRIERGAPLSWDFVGPLGCDRIAGKRLCLRRLNAVDTGVVLKWRSDPAIAGQFFSQHPPTRAGHEAFLAALQRRFDREEFIIVLAEDDRPVGQIGLSRIDLESGTAEFGVLIGERDCRGKGLAYEAGALLLRYGFRELGLRRIVLNLFRDNVEALALYTRLGFAEDPAASGRRFKDGVPRPTLSMYLDRQEWETRESLCPSSAS